jgi:hypothetical protein
MGLTFFSSGRPRRRATFRPQLEVLETRLAPGSLHGMGHPPMLDDDDDRPGQQREVDILAQTAAIRTTSPVVDFATQTVVFGESTLTRTENGITAHFSASGLEPGVYTFWMRVDAPDGSIVSGRVAGHVVGNGGHLNFSAHVSVGEVLSGNPDFPSGPLQDPLHSQIRLVVRSHGPAEPGRIHEQTHTYEPDRAFNFLISVHAPPA